MPPRLGYRPALDGFRAVAILLVLLHHTGAFLLPGFPTWFFPGGFLGVDLFFALSGFLITTLLLERRGQERRPIVRFYERRALRLFPAVIALLLVVVLVTLVVDGDDGTLPTTAAAVVTYGMNWFEVGGSGVSHYLTHLWSLSVEEQFYLLWPLLLYGGLRLIRAPARLAVVVAGLALVVTVWRAVLWHRGVGWIELYIRTDTEADGLLLGAAVALAPWRLVVDRLPVARADAVGGAALAAILAAALLVQRDWGALYLGGLTVLAVLALLVILSALRGGRLTAVLAVAPMVLIGRLSYSLYLWHFPVFVGVQDHTHGWSTGPRVAAAWVLAFGAAWLSYRFVETPALAYKRKIGERRAAATA